MIKGLQSILTSALVVCAAVAVAQPKVMILEVRDDIDPRSNRYVKLGLEEATEQDVDLVLIDMNTYGGAVNDADDIRTRLLEYDKPVWVFVNKNAASAGALISIACDSIYMAPGANIGAATVVQGGTGEAAPDKYQSYFRSIMRSTAEANGRDPRIAEAMVDQSLEVDSISPAGQVITFTATEAKRYGYCEGIVNSIDEIYARNGIENPEEVRFTLGWSEKIIALVLNPFVSGILLLVIVGGLYFELQTPGVGFPIAAALVAAVLYFIPYYLNGLAANWEIIAVAVGIGLIAAEVFVIPGFGVAGIAGLVLTFGGLMLVMLDNDVFDFRFVPDARIAEAGLSVALALFGTLALLVFGGLSLTRSKRFQRIALQNTMDSKEGYSSRFETPPLVGKVGTTYTVLRPGGKVMIDGQLYDATTRGDYIGQGESVVVLQEDITTLRVKKHEGDALPPPPAPPAG